ncbi:MAG: molybdopterin-dependent oxidoreductase [Hymenobacter sp.]
MQDFNPDIHCVTKWSKFDTHWRGVSVDTLLEHVQLKPEAQFVTAVQLRRLHHQPATGRPARRAGPSWACSLRASRWPPEHGGPARLVVPHLYFWKSAKWVQGLRFTADDEPGFWERAGYSMHGDPWQEQRYRDDDEPDGQHPALRL